MKKVKFENAVDEYLKECELNLKYNSYRTIRNRIETNILPYFKNYKINKITTNDYKNWKLFIDNKNYSYTYKKNLHICFVIFLNYCIREYNLKENIASKVGNFKNKEISKIGNIWTLEEFNKFINSVDDPKYKVFFKLLYFTGMRKGEILALTWNDIDFNNKTININKSITRIHKINNTKSYSSNRNIFIPENILNELELLKNNSKENLIFNFSFTTLKRKKDYYCNLSNVKQIKIHEFRHSHACFLFQNNVPIDEISSRLGHSSISMTQDIYLRYLPKKETNTIQLLSSGII